MNKQINTALAITVIILIAGILGSVVYFSNSDQSQMQNISGQKQSADAKKMPEPSQQSKEVDETSTPPVSDSNKVREIAFDGCGKIDKYKNESWYSNFIKILNDDSIAINDISEACLSLDKTMLIAITGGDYCETGLLFQYNVSRNVLAKAVFDDHERGCVAWPAEFGKGNGKIISLQGSSGDAGCIATMYYDYNYVDNKIELKRECGKCEGDKQETCSNF